uniref:PDZ domain-containing protein n=1 Tax=Romanomermis culicivorax TaxID=13658 RepID=A0A915I0I8_ROMCU
MLMLTLGIALKWFSYKIVGPSSVATGRNFTGHRQEVVEARKFATLESEKPLLLVVGDLSSSGKKRRCNKFSTLENIVMTSNNSTQTDLALLRCEENFDKCFDCTNYHTKMKSLHDLDLCDIRNSLEEPGRRHLEGIEYEIEVNSIADKDGRVRIGDQILQINGIDIHTRNQAIDLFSKDYSDICLLLARNILGDEETSEDSKCDMTCQPLLEESFEEHFEKQVEDSFIYEESNGRLSGDSCLEKDSGISRNSDSDLEIIQTLPHPVAAAPFSQTSPSSSSSSSKSGTSRFENSNFALETKLRQSPQHHATNEKSDSDTLIECALEKELTNLHKEMEMIQLECDRLIEQHAQAEQKMKQQLDLAGKLSSMVDKHLAKNNDQASGAKKFVSDDVVNRSSDDNLDDGKRDSAVFTLPKYRQKFEHNTAECFNNELDYLESTSSFVAQYSAAEAVLNDRRQRGVLKQQQRRPAQDHTVMYTKPENLHKTISLQQKLIRQAMINQAQKLKIENHYYSICDDDQQQQKAQNSFEHQVYYGNWGAAVSMENKRSESKNSIKMQWKVKRRSDGSRYVTRKPLRTKILKERAEKVSYDRIGVSTDDDAMSELKIGRYWSKEERKKHIERQKERKRRQEEIVRRHNEALLTVNDQPIILLSHRKMLRHQGQQLFDKFTTLQEMLAHGAKLGPQHSRPFGGLLSVTTV